MATAVRFHLDENVDPQVAEGLRHRGIDVTTTVDAHLLHAADEEHIAFAAHSSRVIFTHDADFLRRSANGEAHEGIVYCHKSSRTIGEIVAHLALIHDCLSPNEMRGRVEFV